MNNQFRMRQRQKSEGYMQEAIQHVFNQVLRKTARVMDVNKSVTFKAQLVDNRKQPGRQKRRVPDE